MSKAALHKRDTVQRFALWALITVELLMSFSFLGYIHVEPISITTAYIPVLLAGALLGPADSAILGLVFGLASMWKASANYVMEADHLFSPLFSGYPLGSIMLSVGSRTLFGLAAGLLYDLAKKLRPTHESERIYFFMKVSDHAVVTQSSSLIPGTLINSFVLCVTTVRPRDIPCAAINVSYGPIGRPLFSSCARTCPAAIASSVEKGKIVNGDKNTASFLFVSSPHLLLAAPYSSSNTVIEDMAISEGSYENTFSVMKG